MAFKGILWDCDGCLIDSELIACGISAQLLTEAGFPIAAQDYVDRFAGQGKKSIYDAIRTECGIDYKTTMEAGDKQQRREDAFRKDLKAIKGIEECLDAIDLPTAIASGSDMARLELTLKITGLWERFGLHIYSSSLVPKGKPFPDIFLYAAERIGVAPTDCLVIEDSLNGVRAGVAAGMTVFGFTGGSHVPDKAHHEKRLLDLGAALVFHDMAALPGLIDVGRTPGFNPGSSAVA